MRKETAVGIIQNCLVVLLFLAMLVQCVLYISFARVYDDGTLPPFPEGEKEILASGGSYVNDAGGAYLFPYFVAGISENGRCGGAYEDEAAFGVMGLFAEILENAPEGSAKKISFSDDAKKYAYLEELYTKTEDCYYVKLKNGIGFSVLCQLASDTYSELPQNPDFVVCDMFLVSDAWGQASIVAVDSNGDALEIRPSKGIAFNKDYLEMFNSTDKDLFDFVRLEVNAENGRSCYFPVYRYTVAHRKILKREFSDCFDISNERGDIRDFLGVFGMNADNTRMYRAVRDDAMICVEGATTFEIAPDGGFRFSPGDGGVKIDSFLGRNDGMSYGFFDYCSAAGNVAEALGEIMEGSCAMLSLDGIYYDNGVCTFRYSYTVDGIPLDFDGREYGLSLSFKGDRLTGASGFVSVIRDGGEVRTELPQRTAYALMEKTEGPISYFGARYVFGEDEETADVGVVRWSVLSENYNKGDVQ